MNRLVLAVLFVAVFAVSLAAMMPLGAGLAWTGAGSVGLSAHSVSGSIWNGRLDDMRLKGIRLGSVAARLDPVSMLTATRRVRLQSRQGNAILVMGRAHGLDGGQIAVDIAALGLGLPVEGVVRLDGATLLFENGRCLKAAGRLTADIGQGAWKAPTLAGAFACDGGVAVARLSGRDAGSEVNLVLRVDANARYRLDTKVASDDEALLLALGLAGFNETAGGMGRLDQGRFGT